MMSNRGIYNSDYLPKGPSESSRIRLYAEQQLKLLKGSDVMLERASFLKYLTGITNNIIGVPPPEKRIGYGTPATITSDVSSVTQKQRLESNQPMYITSDMRQSSIGSLDKLKTMRQKIQQNVGLHFNEQAPQPMSQSRSSSQRNVDNNQQSHVEVNNFHLSNHSFVVDPNEADYNQYIQQYHNNHNNERENHVHFQEEDEDDQSYNNINNNDRGESPSTRLPIKPPPHIHHRPTVDVTNDDDNQYDQIETQPAQPHHRPSFDTTHKTPFDDQTSSPLATSLSINNTRSDGLDHNNITNNNNNNLSHNNGNESIAASDGESEREESDAESDCDDSSSDSESESESEEEEDEDVNLVLTERERAIRRMARAAETPCHEKPRKKKSKPQTQTTQQHPSVPVLALPSPAPIPTAPTQSTVDRTQEQVETPMNERLLSHPVVTAAASLIAQHKAAESVTASAPRAVERVSSPPAVNTSQQPRHVQGIQPPPEPLSQPTVRRVGLPIDTVPTSEPVRQVPPAVQHSSISATSSPPRDNRSIDVRFIPPLSRSPDGSDDRSLPPPPLGREEFVRPTALFQSPPRSPTQAVMSAQAATQPAAQPVARAQPLFSRLTASHPAERLMTAQPLSPPEPQAQAQPQQPAVHISPYAHLQQHEQTLLSRETEELRRLKASGRVLGATVAPRGVVLVGAGAYNAASSSMQSHQQAPVQTQQTQPVVSSHNDIKRALAFSPQYYEQQLASITQRNAHTSNINSSNTNTSNRINTNSITPQVSKHNYGKENMQRDVREMQTQFNRLTHNQHLDMDSVSYSLDNKIHLPPSYTGNSNNNASYNSGNSGGGGVFSSNYRVPTVPQIPQVMRPEKKVINMSNMSLEKRRELIGRS